MFESPLVSKARNWVLTGLVVLVGAGFLSFQFWDAAGRCSWRLGECIGLWWEAGVFLGLAIPLVGYAMMQLLAGGNLTPRALFSTLAWLALIPFLALGTSCSTAFDGASALGWIGEGSVWSTTVLTQHASRDEAGSPAYYLVVRAEWDQWVDPIGEVVHGAGGVLVNAENFAKYRPGAKVKVAVWPPPFSNEYRLIEELEADTRSKIRWAVLWAFVSFGSLLLIRNQLVRLEHVSGAARGDSRQPGQLSA